MYINSPTQIQDIIQKLSHCKTLWMDTEIADWKTKHPQLSLIQVLTDCQATSEAETYILDVLKQPHLIQLFIEQIMQN